MIAQNQWKPVWIVLAGFLVALAGFIMTVFSEHQYGSIFSLVGALILLVGGVMIAVTSKRAK